MIINTREDLDSVVGTPEHEQFMSYLKGSIEKQENTQTYPEDYNTPDYAGVELEPIWSPVKDLSVITAFGFKESDFK